MLHKTVLKIKDSEPGYQPVANHQKLIYNGAIVINTGEFTGRCPKDKFIVRDEITYKIVNWNEFNMPIELKYFDIIYRKIIYYIDRLPDLWIRDCYACADEKFRLNIR